MKERQIAKAERNVALHEGGHVAVHVLLGVPFTDVTIETEELIGGSYVAFEGAVNCDFNVFRSAERTDHNAFRLDALCLLAGPAVSRHLNLQHVCGNDMEQSYDDAWVITDENAVQSFADDPEHDRRALALQQSLLAEAEQLVSAPSAWRIVEAVADALIARRELSYADVLAIVKDTKAA
jgi:hypothetical protein